MAATPARRAQAFPEHHPPRRGQLADPAAPLTGDTRFPDSEGTGFHVEPEDDSGDPQPDQDLRSLRSTPTSSASIPSRPSTSHTRPANTPKPLTATARKRSTQAASPR